MAPSVGPDREQVLAMLRGWRKPKRPITLGRGEPVALIDVWDGEWQLRRLEVDRERRDAAYERARQTQPFHWMPENEARFFVPGTVLAAGSNPAELADAIESIDWLW